MQKYKPLILTILATFIVVFLCYKLYFFALNLEDLPSTIWKSDTKPGNLSNVDANTSEVGVKFCPLDNGYITGIRFYKDTNQKGIHTGSLWSNAGQRLATVTFSDETPSGWQQASFSRPIPVLKDLVYIASYTVNEGNYFEEKNYFHSSKVKHLLLEAESGVYKKEGKGFPDTPSTSNYWVDVVFHTSTAVADNGLQELPPTGPGGPILIITSAKNPSSTYYEEILKAEGLNEYRTQEIATITPKVLNKYDVVLLAEMPLSSTQVEMLKNWVLNGGNLIAMRPDKKLADLLGLKAIPGLWSEGYLLIDKNEFPGLVDQTIQFHGDADRYLIEKAKSIATLYQNATESTLNPAVTLNVVGNKGGKAAAFTFDLAKSIIATRQGNKEWAKQKRDAFRLRTKYGVTSIASDDLFYPNFVDMDKVAIPQADEQQRLLANMILQMNLNKKPLPRFWYLPSGKKAVILHALDDHNDVRTATKQTFDRLKAKSPKDCSVLDWGCFRATSWSYVGILLTDSEALNYYKEGFEMGVHVTTNCRNWTPTSLNQFFEHDLTAFHKAYPSLPPQRTVRTHCVVWSDWSTQPVVELYHRIRLDTNYYYYPPKWVQNRPGFFTGSGIPMPYTDLNALTIDVYQAPTQLSSESGLKFPDAILIMLDRALGPEGYYGVFATHDDYTNVHFLDYVINSALSKGVSIVSAEQVLTWFDGKNNSSFKTIEWLDNTLSFQVEIAEGAHNLQIMLPIKSLNGFLDTITRNNQPVNYTKEIIKGIPYALFLADDGNYLIRYSQNE